MHRLEAYITLAVIFILIITIIYLPIMWGLKKRGKSILRQLSYLGLFCAIFLIIFATILFTPISLKPETHTLNLIPFSWIGSVDKMNQFIIEKVPNILIFIPLGVFIPIVFKTMRSGYKTILASFMVTFGIEFTQYFIGRSSDIDDIMTNLFGVIIGYLIYRTMNKVFKNSRRWKSLLKEC